MAQIPNQRQAEVSLEVALPTQDRLRCAWHKSDCLRGAAKGSKGSPVRRLNSTNCLYWRESPSSLELLEK